MSQKKAKLLNKFIKITGQDDTGQQFKTNSTNKIGKDGKLIEIWHTLRDDKRIKKSYKDLNYRQKTVVTAVMLSVIKKYDKTKKTSV